MGAAVEAVALGATTEAVAVTNGKLPVASAADGVRSGAAATHRTAAAIWRSCSSSSRARAARAFGFVDNSGLRADMCAAASPLATLPGENEGENEGHYALNRELGCSERRSPDLGRFST